MTELATTWASVEEKAQTCLRVKDSVLDELEQRLLSGDVVTQLGQFTVVGFADAVALHFVQGSKRFVAYLSHIDPLEYIAQRWLPHLPVAVSEQEGGELVQAVRDMRASLMQ